MINHVGTETIETGRLILRRFEYTDNDSMRRNWVSDEDIQWGYGEPVYETKEAVKELLDKYIGSYENPDYLRWAIIEKDSGECIGQIAYYLVDTKNHFGEIEYCIGSSYQGKGYATESAKVVIAYGFDRVNFNRVQICCRTPNNASRKVIEKCGLTYEGVLRDYFYRRDHYEGRVIFSMLRDEYYSKISSCK